MRKLLKKIRNFVLDGIRNKFFFYGSNVCSFSVGWLLYANVIKPSRTYRRLKNNKSNRLEILNLVQKTKPSTIGTNVKFDRTNPKESFEFAMKVLRTHGAVVIEEYFDAAIIDGFLEKYKSEISDIKSGESRFGYPLVLSSELLRIWLDQDVQKFIGQYFGTQQYCRSYPLLQYVDRSSAKECGPGKDSIAYPWHIDHCPILPQMVYLADVDPNGTCMEIVSASHHFPSVALGTFSDEYINSLNADIKRLSGPKGSIQLHDPNVVHRAAPKNNSDRLWLYSDFSWGENILMDINTIVKMLSRSEVQLTELTQEQRNALSGIFPRSAPKGYQMSNGYLKPQISQDI